MTNREIFMRNLYNLMKSAKLKQKDVAEYAQVSYQTVSAWICGRAYPRADAMQRLCKVFGCPMSALTEDKDSELPEDRLAYIFHSLSVEGKVKLMERAEEVFLLYRGNNRGKAKTKT